MLIARVSRGMGAQTMDGSYSAGSRRRGTRAATLSERYCCNSFGSNFQAEDVFAGYLMPNLAEKSPYPLDRHEVSLMMARFSEVTRMRRLWSTSKLFCGDPPISARAVGYHKYSRMEMNGTSQQCSN